MHSSIFVPPPEFFWTTILRINKIYMESNSFLPQVTGNGDKAEVKRTTLHDLTPGKSPGRGKYCLLLLPCGFGALTGWGEKVRAWALRPAGLGCATYQQVHSFLCTLVSCSVKKTLEQSQGSCEA